ncbi:hypothetical protein HDU67_003413, partial [Dinochytrium kinnereticum]
YATTDASFESVESTSPAGNIPTPEGVPMDGAVVIIAERYSEKGLFMALICDNSKQDTFYDEKIVPAHEKSSPSYAYLRSQTLESSSSTSKHQIHNSHHLHASTSVSRSATSGSTSAPAAYLNTDATIKVFPAKVETPARMVAEMMLELPGDDDAPP